MSTARPRDGKASNSIVSNHEQQQLQPELHDVSSSSWGRNDDNKINISNNNSTSMSTYSFISHKEDESDEDLLTVPDVENPPATANNNTNSAQPAEIQNQKRRRGRNPADKEYRRLKRLLRNRVSAQQARERKKVYVNDLELRATQLQDRNSKLEEKILTLINENTMLRKVLLNTRPKVDESIEQKQDQLSKS